LVTVGSLSAAAASAAEGFPPLGAFAPTIEQAPKLPRVELLSPPSLKLPAIPVLPLVSGEVKGLKVRGRF
jgi:hypothetical protein